MRRRVALKLIKADMDTREAVARFESERQALALMNHPHIARVFDAGTTDQGRPFFVMEFVQGVPITQHCDRHRLALPERLQLFSLVCEAVQHAHQKGIIHRDIKPSNVLVCDQDGKPMPKVIDFGVAKATSLRLTERTLYTRHGMFLGTPEYSSPEQAELSGDVDTRADIYSLGMLLYELLVGDLPFDRARFRQVGPSEMLRIIREEEPARPSLRLATLGAASGGLATKRRTDVPALRKQLRGDLDWIVLRALDKDRARRYQSASELAVDILRHERHEPVLACPPSPRYRIGKFARRHRMSVSVATGVVALLMAFAATMTVQARRIARERDRANREAETAQEVSDFLVDLFEVADPEAGRGNSVTARELLDQGAQRIDRELANKPMMQAQLMEVMGKVYRRLGLYDRARTLHEAALDLRRKELGDSHLDLTENMNSLANVYKDQGNLDQAEVLFRRSLAIREQTLGPMHPKVALALNNLANLLSTDRGLFDEAEPLHERALAIRRKALGPEHPDVAQSLMNLGRLNYLRGRYRQAEPFYKESVAIYEATSGPEHPGVARVLHNLSLVYWRLGRLSEARQHMQQALAIRKKVYGPEHLFAAYSLEDLAAIDRDLGRFAAAESAQQRSLAIKEKALGPDHPRVATALNNLGITLVQMGKYERALPLLERCLALRQSKLGPDHPKVADVLESLGQLWWRAGEPEKARPLLERALAIQEKKLDPNDVLLAATLHTLGGVLRDTGQVTEAEARLQRALVIREQVLGADHTRVAETLQEYAKLLRSSRRHDEAEAMEARARSILGKPQQPGS